MTETLVYVSAFALVSMLGFRAVCTSWGMRLAWLVIIIGLAYLSVKP